MRISIAMATFNGAKYIRQQLDSLTNQTYLPFELVVCDDGSTDDTLSIVREYAQSAPFQVHVYRNASNLGFANNFLKCAALCSGDWIAFCDQDDIWLTNKLATTRDVINQSSDNLVLVYHVAELVDKNLRSLGIKLPAIDRARVFPRAGNSGFWFVGGCVMCFKATLIQDINPQLRPRDNFQFNEGWFSGKYPWMPHDKWICMLANISGEIAATPRILSLYRRHDHALTGSHESRSAATRIQNHLSIDSESYDFLSNIAAETANALLKISDGAKSIFQRENLIEGARQYMDISHIFKVRAKLYAAKNFMDKVTYFRKLMSAEAYWGNTFCPLGFPSWLKDFLFVVGFISIARCFIKRKLT